MLTSKRAFYIQEQANGDGFELDGIFMEEFYELQKIRGI